MSNDEHTKLGRTIRSLSLFCLGLVFAMFCEWVGIPTRVFAIAIGCLIAAQALVWFGGWLFGGCEERTRT